MTDTPAHFLNEMRTAGLEPPHITEPGKTYRFPGIDGCKDNTTGWCMLFDNSLGGCFGDWSEGFTKIWHPPHYKLTFSLERIELLRNAHNARISINLSLQKRHAKAAVRANRIWEAAPPAPINHPYAVTRGIKFNRARLHKNSLLLPITNIAGELINLLLITQNGHTQFLPGGEKSCCFIHVAGNFDATSNIIICEEWATGCTLSNRHPNSIILAAIDTGNLKPLALTFRQYIPTCEMTIAGDDDRKAHGGHKFRTAIQAAVSANAQVTFPRWPADAPETLTTFNDLSVWLKECP